MTKASEQCQECGRWPNRPLCVDVVAVQDGRVLLVKRGREPYKGMWALPGGHVDYDETLQEAAARELLEETGLKLAEGEMVGVKSDPGRDPAQAVTIIFKAAVSGDARAGDDATEVSWWRLDELPALAFDHLDIIESAR